MSSTDAAPTMATHQLERARTLTMPGREAMLRRDPSVGQFWLENRQLLQSAWQEWDASELGEVARPDSSLLDPALRTAVAQAWEDPSTDGAVRALLHESAPNVYSFQFFDPERLAEFRSYLGQVWDAQIPLRPPYGILLNRGGAMLDPRSEGYLAAPSFQSFYRDLMDTYMRPIARLLFPAIAGFDTQTFGFSINYKPTTETSIRPHTDASSVTLNINVNVPGEEFTGSTVDFYDQATDQVNALTFEPGTAMIHRGDVPHTAQAITSGERTNLVLWLFGDRGQVPRFPFESDPTAVPLLAAEDRWVVPEAELDGHAPF